MALAGRTDRVVAATGARDARPACFTIHDLVAEFDVTARTLRFYEEKGLLAPARRGQERLYSRRDRARLKLVLMGKSVGFSLEEVRDMLDLYDLGDGQATQLSVALKPVSTRRSASSKQRRRDIDRALAELTHARDVVTPDWRVAAADRRTLMPSYKAPVDDVMFLLEDVLDIARYHNLPGFEEATPDTVRAILEEGAKICEESCSRSTSPAIARGAIAARTAPSRHRRGSARLMTPIAPAASSASTCRRSMAASDCPRHSMR